MYLAKLTYSINETIEALGLSRQTVYNEINAGRLRSFRVGKRRLVSNDALQEWVKAREIETRDAA